MSVPKAGRQAGGPRKSVLFWTFARGPRPYLLEKSVEIWLGPSLPLSGVLVQRTLAEGDSRVGSRDLDPLAVSVGRIARPCGRRGRWADLRAESDPARQEPLGLGAASAVFDKVSRE